MKNFITWMNDKGLLSEMARMNDRKPWVFQGKNEEGEFEGGVVNGPSVREVLAKHPEGLDIGELVSALGAGEVYDSMSKQAQYNALKSLRAQITRWADKGMLQRIRVGGKSVYKLGKGRSLDSVLDTQGLGSDQDPQALSPENLIHQLQLQYNRYVKRMDMGVYKDAQGFVGEAAKALRRFKMPMSSLIHELSDLKDNLFKWDMASIIASETPDLYSEPELLKLLQFALLDWWVPTADAALKRIAEKNPEILRSLLERNQDKPMYSALSDMILPLLRD